MIFFKRLPKAIRADVAELQKMETYFDFAAREVLKNTALVPHGKNLGKQLEAVAALIRRRKMEITSAAIAKMGLTNVLVNFLTGRIKTHHPHAGAESKDSRQAA